MTLFTHCSLEVTEFREIGDGRCNKCMSHSFSMMAHCKPSREVLVVVRDAANKMVVATYVLKNLETLSLTIHGYQTLKITERNIPC
jgi:hypothetical protein